MNDLDQALVDIRKIRRQVAESTEFRGYGPATLFATAVIALLAGIAQSHFQMEPVAHPVSYVALWLSTAVFCSALIATQMLRRAVRFHCSMADEMIRSSVTQFLPAAFAGAILPFVLLHVSQSAVWMLPGLWQILFSLGVFASCRAMPRSMLFAGAWFLLTGFACLALGNDRALAPAAMAGPFAVGMAMVAAIHRASTRKGTVDEASEL